MRRVVAFDSFLQSRETFSAISGLLQVGLLWLPTMYLCNLNVTLPVVS